MIQPSQMNLLAEKHQGEGRRDLDFGAESKEYMSAQSILYIEKDVVEKTLRFLYRKGLRVPRGSCVDILTEKGQSKSNRDFSKGM